jgi:hypothetical protein
MSAFHVATRVSQWNRPAGVLQPSGNVRRNMTKRYHLPILLACAAIGVACGSEKLFEPPVLTTIEFTPAGASILQGGSVTVGVTLRRSGGFTGGVNLTVTDRPTGVAAVVSKVQTTGSEATATLTLNVSGSTIPRYYTLTVHASGTGVTEATKAFALTVKPSASCPASGGVCEQWAESATASSEYTSTEWSANQATGEPNAGTCNEDGNPNSWASLQSNGVNWLELVYHETVRPTEIHIYEGLGASSIVKVEVKDGAGTYHTVYTAQPEYQACPRVFTIPVTGISAMVKVVRLSFDQRALINWDEIDAVKLIGDR